MQVDVTINGGRILWNHNVRIYDEKPTNFIASFRQRVRWSQGHWFVALRNTPRLMKVWLKGGVSFAEMLALLTYMYSMAAPVFMLLLFINGLLEYLNPLLYGHVLAAAMIAAEAAVSAGGAQHGLWSRVLMSLSSVLMIGYSFVVLYWWAERVDNGKRLSLLHLPYILLSYGLNLINVSATQVLGLFKHRQQNKWVKTRHKIRQQQSIGAPEG